MRGGKRTGAGRPAPNGTKKAVTIRLYDTQIEKLKQAGGVQKVIDELIQGLQ